MQDIVYRQIATLFYDQGIKYEGPITAGSAQIAWEQGDKLEPPPFTTMADPEYWKWFFDQSPRSIELMIKYHAALKRMLRLTQKSPEEE